MAEKHTCAIILAAGTSSRMGVLKQLLPFGDKPLLKHVIDKTLTENFRAVYTVIGYESERVKSDINILDKRHHWITNDDYLNGQSTSLKKVLQYINLDYDNAMIFLGDMPFIKSETIECIHFEGRHLSLEHNEPFMIRPQYHKKIGHPVFIGNINGDLIEQLKGDSGFKSLKNIFKVRKFIEVEDEGTNLDIDTKNQYKASLEKLENEKK